MEHYEQHTELKQCLDKIANGFFSPDQPDLFKDFIHDLKYHDEYLILADYASYVACQEKVNDAFKNQKRWTKMSILNTARSGKFSSDRSVLDYCQDIWKVKPVTVKLPQYDPREQRSVDFKDLQIL